MEQTLKFYDSPRITGEILDCSLPMSMDTYSKCGFNCLYCFSYFQKSLSSTMGTNYMQSQVRWVNPEKIYRLFSTGEGHGKLFQKLIKNRIVLQWGGLADQFDQHEKKYGITLELLKFFKKINYPITFSTKSTWWVNDDKYIELFRNQDNWNCKFSIINLNPEIAQKIERGCPSPEERLKAMAIYSKFNKGGVTLRLRPFIMGMSDVNDEYLDLIKKAHICGATAVSVEFMCVEARATINTKQRFFEMSKVLGFDVYAYYKKNSIDRGYYRLNRQLKLKYVEKMYELSKKLGMRFYCSDAHIKDYCHNACCCGLDESWNYSRIHLTEALMLAKKNGTVKFSDVKFDKYNDMNLEKDIHYHFKNGEHRAKYCAMSLMQFFRNKWNNVNAQNGMYVYFAGMLKPIGYDLNKDIIYKYEGENIIK